MPDAAYHLSLPGGAPWRHRRVVEADAAGERYRSDPRRRRRDPRGERGFCRRSQLRGKTASPGCGQIGSSGGMLFYEAIFSTIFFPTLYAIYLALRERVAARKWTLLIGSAVFYTWGEPLFVPVLLASSL